MQNPSAPDLAIALVVHRPVLNSHISSISRISRRIRSREAESRQLFEDLTVAVSANQGVGEAGSAVVEAAANLLADVEALTAAFESFAIDLAGAPGDSLRALAESGGGE